MKVFFKKAAPFLTFLPVLVIELFVFKKNLENYLASQNQISPVLGLGTNILSASAIEKVTIGVVIFLTVLLVFLILKEEK